MLLISRLYNCGLTKFNYEDLGFKCHIIVTLCLRGATHAFNRL